MFLIVKKEYVYFEATWLFSNQYILSYVVKIDHAESRGSNYFLVSYILWVMNSLEVKSIPI